MKALSGVSAKSLVEFETDAAIGGSDPFGLLADSFPNLRMLRVKYMLGKRSHLPALKRLTKLCERQCVLPGDRLRGRPAVDTEKGIVYWGITSGRHCDYRGDGLWWDELRNTCECMEEWDVGKGVTKEQCLEFMEDCGIELNNKLDDEECGMMDDCFRSGVDSETELDTVVVQLEIEDSAGATGTLVIQARTMDGREFAQVTLDANKTLTRTLVEELASKYPCSPRRSAPCAAWWHWHRSSRNGQQTIGRGLGVREHNEDIHMSPPSRAVGHAPSDTWAGQGFQDKLQLARPCSARFRCQSSG